MAKKTHGTTIIDIAKAAGVSTATVSRVLNDVDYPVRPELRKRVLETARAYNYSPNIFGRMLRNGKSTDIGVIIPSFSNPFFAELVSSIEAECYHRGYNPIFCSSHNDLQRELELIDQLLQRRVAGIIIRTISQDGSFLLNVQRQTNVIALGQFATETACNSISFDFFGAGALATEYLLEQGHRDIAFLTLPLQRKSHQAVHDGIVSTMMEHGLSLKKDHIFVRDVEQVFGNYQDEFETGRLLARQYLDAGCPATAIISIDDMIAFGIISELSSKGVSVPDDCSVIGLDNISTSCMINPPLTTIAQHAVEAGQLATKVLIDSIEQETGVYSSLVIKPSLIERKSVKKRVTSVR